MSSTLISLLKADEAKKKAETEKPKLEVVPKIEPDPPVEIRPENDENTGQPVNQKVVNQLTTLVNQSEELLVDQVVNQSEKKLVNQSNQEKMYRSRRDRKLKGLRLPTQKLEKWQLWCFINKLDFQDAVELAMDWLTGQPVNHVLIDDIDEDKETDEIIIFYRKWTGNKIKSKDRTARDEVKRFSDDICKIGILTAISRAKTKINSFAYCVPVIEDIAEEAGAIESKGDYLKHLERFIMSVRKGK
jgi:hypothetical protein